MLTWTDAHNHLQDPRLGPPGPVIDAMRAAGITRCITNATCEEDWPIVENLALNPPGFIIPAFGIHPWHAHTATLGWQSRLTSILETHPHATVGECGLDRWISSPTLEIQIPIFRNQIRIAREMNRPLTIHCLRAWDALFAAFAEFPPPSRFLMHSFSGSIEIARRLLPLGAWFSFSGYFLHARKHTVLEMFRQLPTDRILLESDAPDMRPPDGQITHPLPANLNHPANLPSIGAALAQALGMPTQRLAEITHRNASDWLDH